jgi:hypothetical protein
MPGSAWARLPDGEKGSFGVGEKARLRLATAREWRTADRAKSRAASVLLQISLDGVGLADVRSVGVAPGIAQGAPLPKQVPAAVEFDLHGA